MKLQDDAKRVVAAAEELGFTLDPEVRGSGHLTFRGYGQQLVHPATSSDWRACKNMIAHMERISGKKLQRHNHRRSRKHDKGPKYIETRRTQTEEWVSGRLDALLKEHERLVQKFQEIALKGTKANRTEVNEAIKIVRRIGEIETVFVELKKPAPPFDPTNPFS